MGKFGDRMAHAFIYRAREIASLNVRNGNIQIGGRDSGREHFVSVAAENNGVRQKRIKGVCEFARTKTSGLRHSKRCSALKRHHDFCRARKLIPCEEGWDIAVRRKNRRRTDNNLNLHILARAECLKNEFVPRIMDFRGNNKTNLSFFLCLLHKKSIRELSL